MIDQSRRRLLTAAAGAALVPASSSSAERGHDRDPAASVGIPAGHANAVRTGGSRTVKIDGRHDVWVKQVGTGNIPVLTLHGGPGFNHFYLECFEDFLPAAGIRYWYYDQLGCGFSDAPTDDSLWTVERYRDEVEQVRRALGLDRFILFGHSWGGMLTLEYALKYPQHLAGIVVSNMTASVAEYVKHAEVLLARLPPDVQAIISRHRAAGDYDSTEYQRVLMEQVYRRHVCRLDPWPEPVQRTFRTVNARIYNYMQGPDEFNITGTFRNWDVWGRLPAIKLPALLIAARHDEMAVDQIQRMGTLIPGARVAVCEKGSHMAMYDDQQAYFNALIPFLQSVHASGAV